MKIRFVQETYGLPIEICSAQLASRRSRHCMASTFATNLYAHLTTPKTVQIKSIFVPKDRPDISKPVPEPPVSNVGQVLTRSQFCVSRTARAKYYNQLFGLS